MNLDIEQRAKELDEYLNDLANLLDTGWFPRDSVKECTFYHKNLNLKDFVQKGREYLGQYLNALKELNKNTTIDIEDRAQEYLNNILPASSSELIKALNAYRDAMTEERERGKRFGKWISKGNWKWWGHFYSDSDIDMSEDDLFTKFLYEEKALNN